MVGRARLWGVVVCGVVAGCGGSGQKDDTIDFPTGDFIVKTTVVDDRCLDGGLNLLFMPEGIDTPWQWPYPVALHAEKDLPLTYEIELREPFGKMTVTANDAGPNVQSIVAEKNVGVLLGPAQFGECVADIGGTVRVEIVDSNSATGLADLDLSNPRGDDRCPTNMPASCKVLLSFEAQRL